MPECVIEYDLDETGKMMNLRRREEVVRCRECVFCNVDRLFHMHWCRGRMVRPYGYCNEGRKG